MAEAALIPPQISAGDRKVVQHGALATRRGGDPLQVWNADYRPVSLANFYRGRHAFLLCGGPSLRSMDLEQLRRPGIVTMALNNAWLVHRPHLWCSVDGPDRFADTRWKDPSIIKFIPAANITQKLGVVRPGEKKKPSSFTAQKMPGVLIYQRDDTFDHRRFLDGPGASWGSKGGVKCSLGHSGKRTVMLPAIRILYYLGFGTVTVIGADFEMTEENRYAFDEGRTKAAINHNMSAYPVTNDRLAALEPVLRQGGMRVQNATPGGNMTAFPRIAFEEAVKAATDEAERPTSEKGWYQE